jgi:hypothetical protein
VPSVEDDVSSDDVDVVVIVVPSPPPPGATDDLSPFRDDSGIANSGIRRGSIPTRFVVVVEVAAPRRWRNIAVVLLLGQI